VGHKEDANGGTNLFGEDPDVSKRGSKLTVNGYDIREVKSALQKAIRRGQEEESMFWAREMGESGLMWSLWNRLKVIAVEDVAGMEPMIFVAQASFASTKSSEPTLFAVRAALELARAKKDRTADDYLCWIGDKLEIDGDKSAFHPIPDEALDLHTPAGRRMGRGPADFFHVGAVLVDPSDSYDTKYLDEQKQRYPVATKGADDDGQSE